jgi:hypothetical protein
MPVTGTRNSALGLAEPLRRRSTWCWPTLARALWHTLASKARHAARSCDGFRTRSRHNPTAVRIREPGLYFLGVHQYVNHAGQGLFAPDKFGMKPVQTPTEREVLQPLVKELEADKELSGYTRQGRLAKRRLAEL